MSSLNPLVSIVMPVYKNDQYLSESIESIQKQTFKNYELIIICDDPSDIIVKTITNFQKNDDRFVVLYREREGLISALNTGCKRAKGKYIARMDADDISLPNRLEKQIEFLEKHTDIAVLGTWIEIIDENGNLIEKKKFPLDPIIIKYHLFFENCIAHPSVMMRRQIIESVNFYSTDAFNDEDTDLWIKISQHNLLTNYPDFLLKYRIHGKNASNFDSQEYDLARLAIRINLYIATLNRSFSKSDKEIVLKWMKNSKDLSNKDLLFLAKLIINLYNYYITHFILKKHQYREVKNFTGIKLFEITKLYSKLDKISLFVLINAYKFNIHYCLFLTIYNISCRIRFFKN